MTIILFVVKACGVATDGEAAVGVDHDACAMRQAYEFSPATGQFIETFAQILPQ